MRWWWGLLFGGVVAATAACPVDNAKVVEPPPPPTGCVKDVDCKGERICVDGACRDPAPPPSTVVSTPAPSASAKGVAGAPPAPPDVGRPPPGAVTEASGLATK